MKGTKKTLAVSLSMVTTFMAAHQALAADEITMTWNWLADPQHMGYIYAEKLGFYDDVDIDVTFIEGRGSGSTAQIVATGQSEIGLANSPTIIASINNGAPLTIIAPIMQVDTTGIISLREADITEPTDLYGKSINLCNGCSSRAQFDVMAATIGLDLSQIEITSVDGKAAIALIQEGQLDAIMAVPFGTGYAIQNAGFDINYVPAAEYGALTTSTSLFARTDFISENPDLVNRFLSATMKGFEAVYENPEGAAAALHGEYPKSQPESELLRAWNEYHNDIVCPAGATNIGVAPQAILDSTLNVLKRLPDFPADAEISDYFTQGLVTDSPECR